MPVTGQQLAANLRALANDPELMKNPKTSQFIRELTLPELKSISLFLGKAADFDLLPSEANYVWYQIHKNDPVFQFGPFKLTLLTAMSYSMSHGGRETFAFLASDKGMEWLRKNENLRDYLEYMAGW